MGFYVSGGVGVWEEGLTRRGKFVGKARTNKRNSAYIHTVDITDVTIELSRGWALCRKAATTGDADTQTI